MFQVDVAVNILKNDESIPAGYRKATGNIIFTCKMYFTFKASWMKDGHLIPNLENSKYAGVVSCESVRLAVTYPVLHTIAVLATDIRYDYLQAPTSEKHYIIWGHAFGLENIG